MSTRHIAGAARDVVWHELRDAGDMFKSEVGVWRDPDGRFRAYVKDGWGGGVNSKPRPDEQMARRDIARLWDNFHGC